MADNQQEPKKDGLENLPPKEREETQRILSEIDAEKAKADAAADPEAAKKAEEAKAKADADKVKADADAKAKAEAEKNTAPRKKAKLVPEYVLRTAESKAKKREDDLLAEIEKLKTGKAPGETGKPEEKTLPDQEVQKQLDAELEAIATETGIDKKVLAKIVELPTKVTKQILEREIARVNKEADERLSKLNQDLADREIEKEEREFNSDFDKVVLPIIKSEYGDDVSPDTLAEIRETLKERAYDPANENVPLNVIYKGFDEFREFKDPKKKSAEDARPGGERGGESELNFDEATDEQVADMDRDTFEKYSNHMAAKSK